MSLLFRAETQSRPAGPRSLRMRAVVSMPRSPARATREMPKRSRIACLGADGGGIGGVAKHLDGHGAAVSGAQQAADDLALALLTVAVVAEGGQGAAVAFEVREETSYQDQGARPGGGGGRAASGFQGWRWRSQSSMASSSLPETGPRASREPREEELQSGERLRAVASLEAASFGAGGRRWRPERGRGSERGRGGGCGGGRTGGRGRGWRRHGRGPEGTADLDGLVETGGKATPPLRSGCECRRWKRGAIGRGGDRLAADATCHRKPGLYGGGRLGGCCGWGWIRRRSAMGSYMETILL